MKKIIDKFWIFAEKHDAFLHMSLYVANVACILCLNIEWIKMFYLIGFFIYTLIVASISDLQSRTIKSQGELIESYEQEDEIRTQAEKDFYGRP